MVTEPLLVVKVNCARVAIGIASTSRQIPDVMDCLIFFASGDSVLSPQITITRGRVHPPHYPMLHPSSSGCLFIGAFHWPPPESLPKPCPPATLRLSSTTKDP